MLRTLVEIAYIDCNPPKNGIFERMLFCDEMTLSYDEIHVCLLMVVVSHLR